jgi:N utilization substance protein A
VRFDPEAGLVEIFAVKRVVENVENLVWKYHSTKPNRSTTAELDDTVELPKPMDVLGRIAAQTKQVILRKVREAERQNIYNEYSRKIGEMVNGVVKR